MNRVDLLAELDRSYLRLVREIEKLSDTELKIVGVTRLWSVKDLLAHIVFWQERAERRASGQAVEWDPRKGEDKETYVNRLNAEAVAASKHLEGRQLLEIFKVNHARIVEVARGLTDERLADKDFMTLFANDTYAHYDEHCAGVNRFVAQRLQATRQP